MAWQDQDAALAKLADPIKKTDASEPALPEPVDQPVSPEGALSLAGSSHGIAFKSHFRLHDRMLVMVDLILDASTEAELEKQRLIWRRMVSAMSQLLSSVKASIVSMEKYIKTKEQSKEKAALLQKALVDKEAMAKQKADLAARSKKLAQRTGSQPAVHLFFIKKEMFVEFPTKSLNVLPADFDLDEPCSFNAEGPLEAWLTKPIMQLVLTGFGGRYKKMNNFDKDRKASMTLATKQGKEETEQFFYTFTKALEAKSLNISSVAANFKSTSWIFGLAPDYVSFGLAPTSASVFRLLALGSAHVWAVSLNGLLLGFKVIGKEIHDSDALETPVRQMTEADILAMSA